MSLSVQPSSSFVVAVGRDRTGEPRQVGPDTADVKVSAADTGGAFALLEYSGRIEGGPPFHLHHNQDEVFVVRAGEYLFQCGEERSRLTAGDTIFLPRGVPHAFRQSSETGTLLFMFTPAGDMEAFFAALAKFDGPPAPGEAAALFAAHGMEIVGPPIAAD